MPLKVYLAGRYGRRDQLRDVAEELRRHGFIVTSSWLDTTFPLEGGGSSVAPPELRQKHAEEDLADVMRADIVISFTEDPDSLHGKRGGRHVEFGLAVAWGKRAIVVGPRENIFHHLPRVEVYASQWDMMRALTGGS